MPVNSQVDKEDVLYLYTHTMEYYLAIKKNETLLVVTIRMDPEVLH